MMDRKLREEAAVKSQRIRRLLSKPETLKKVSSASAHSISWVAVVQETRGNRQAWNRPEHLNIARQPSTNDTPSRSFVTALSEQVVSWLLDCVSFGPSAYPEHWCSGPFSELQRPALAEHSSQMTVCSSLWLCLPEHHSGARRVDRAPASVRPRC